MKKESQHPMVAVPEAMRTVLTETARIVLQHQQESVAVVDVSSLSSSMCHDLYGRVLASDVVMREPGYPPYAASIMDGFAVHSSTAATAASCSDQEWTHIVVDKVFAGDSPTTTTTTTSSKGGGDSTPDVPVAHYVTTGAVIPDHCDCVVPVEDVVISKDGKYIRIPADKIVAHKWIRNPGCDIGAGEIVLPKGSVMDEIGLGLLLQSGVTSVTLRRKITVGVLSTGNELLVNTSNIDNNDAEKRDWWKDLQQGMIPDVNRPILTTLLSSQFPNINVIDLGMVRDDNVDAMVDKLKAAMAHCDVILTTGGISMGETDIVEHVLVDRLHGKLHFGRLNMKPGKPTTFVTLPNHHEPGDRLVFAMPGNPVSAVVCTHLLVTPCLDLLVHGADTTADTHGASTNEQLFRMVQNARVHAEAQVTLRHDIKLDPERPEYHRVTVDDGGDHHCNNNTIMQVTSTGVQRSSRLMSLRDAQGLLVLPQATVEHPVAKAGETYTVLLLKQTSTTTTLRDRRRGGVVQVCNSVHLNGPQIKIKTPLLQIGIVQAVAAVNDAIDESTLSARVQQALNGSKSGSVSVSSCRVFSDYTERFFEWLDEQEAAAAAVDVVVVACPRFAGSFRHHVKLAHVLRKKLTKVADTVALQARQGVASQDPASAVFEVIVGYRSSSSSGKGSIVILLPEEGLDEGLSNVRGLLKHALRTARGEEHHHH